MTSDYHKVNADVSVAQDLTQNGPHQNPHESSHVPLGLMK